MTTTPLVDIVMPTYNHEKFLVQAIESVLAQKTDFQYRLNIADDCSTDGTQAIIKNYEHQHADRINAILSPRNIGIFNADRLSIKVLKGCTARYVALLEGDDFWTDPYKLQKQVDFLESHPDFAICCHNVMMVYEGAGREPSNCLPPDQPAVSSLEDLLFANVVPACSAVFRRGLFEEFPDWYYTIRLGDWAMHIMNAQYGKIGYLNEVMAVYRIHAAGLWMATSPTSQQLDIIRMMDHIDAYLGFKYKKQIRVAQADRYYQLADAACGQGDQANARIFLKKCFSLRGFRITRQLLGLFLRLETPTLYKRLKTCKDWTRSAASDKSGIVER